ncbi:MAG: glucose 1-dehydrogenase [Desulfuromonadales bacterium]|nr:glucose 1-dehydrogenase [Desulfuromonadales bacterium]
MARLKGKTALVTGGSAGIGQAIALEFAAQGAKVIVSDLNEATGREVVDTIRRRGGDVLFVRHDVTRQDEWNTVMATIAKEFGALHVLVNNAGVTERGNAESISLEDWKAVIDVNLNGVFLGTQAGIQAMKQTGGGSIINVSSALGLIGNPDCSAYTASKGGVRLFTKSAALLCGREGYRIRVNSIHPGVIRTALMDTGLAKAADPEAELQRYIAWHPIGFLGEPQDIAHGAVYLASDEARFVTGSELVIDGGWTAV